VEQIARLIVLPSIGFHYVHSFFMLPSCCAYDPMLGATVQPDLAFCFYVVSLSPLMIMGQIAMAPLTLLCNSKFCFCIGCFISIHTLKYISYNYASIVTSMLCMYTTLIVMMMCFGVDYHTSVQQNVDKITIFLKKGCPG
jgi:hypothetical protein